MPHGYFNRSWLLPLLKEKGYALVHWSFGSDWLLKQTSDEMAQGYIANAKPGAVFLMHDGGNGRKKTFLALQTIVNTLQDRGYQFIRADELFH
jgi:peptidoglycan/xylan/chitin deacetylase (PgdA/CDA1 family)